MLEFKLLITTLYLLNLCYNSDGASIPSDRQFLRSDYTFLEGPQSFYKLHTTLKNWDDAKNTCEWEGAKLFYADNETEIDAILEFRKQTQLYSFDIFIGVSDSLNDGIFETVDGLPLPDMFGKWPPGEPNNTNESEHCVVLNHNDQLKVDDCNSYHYFICRCFNSGTQTNCTNEYTYLRETGRYYKIHGRKMNWMSANEICKVEGAKLFYPESTDELNALNDWKTRRTLRKMYIGIFDPLKNGRFKTIDGKDLVNVYNKWDLGEPNNDGGYQQCGALNIDGTLDDEICNKELPFICKTEGLIKPIQQKSDCGSLDPEYKLNTVLGSCYKFHQIRLGWMDAKRICAEEQSYLAIVNSKMEAEYIGQLLDTVSETSVHIGIDYFSDRWMTIKGEPLSSEFSEMDFEVGQVQPSNSLDHCGGFNSHRKFFTESCIFSPNFFLCELDMKK